jgi:hypothetical protein
MTDYAKWDSFNPDSAEVIVSDESNKLKNKHSALNVNELLFEVQKKCREDLSVQLSSLSCRYHRLDDTVNAFVALLDELVELTETIAKRSQSGRYDGTYRNSLAALSGVEALCSIRDDIASLDAEPGGSKGEASELMPFLSSSIEAILLRINFFLMTSAVAIGEFPLAVDTARCLLKGLNRREEQERNPTRFPEVGALTLKTPLWRVLEVQALCVRGGAFAALGSPYLAVVHLQSASRVLKEGRAIASAADSDGSSVPAGFFPLPGAHGLALKRALAQQEARMHSVAVDTDVLRRHFPYTAVQRRTGLEMERMTLVTLEQPVPVDPGTCALSLAELEKMNASALYCVPHTAVASPESGSASLFADDAAEDNQPQAQKGMQEQEWQRQEVKQQLEELRDAHRVLESSCLLLIRAAVSSLVAPVPAPAPGHAHNTNAGRKVTPLPAEFLGAEADFMHSLDSTSRALLLLCRRSFYSGQMLYLEHMHESAETRYFTAIALAQAALSYMGRIRPDDETEIEHRWLREAEGAIVSDQEEERGEANDASASGASMSTPTPAPAVSAALGSFCHRVQTCCVANILAARVHRGPAAVTPPRVLATARLLFLQELKGNDNCGSCSSCCAGLGDQEVKEEATMRPYAEEAARMVSQLALLGTAELSMWLLNRSPCCATGMPESAVLAFRVLSGLEAAGERQQAMELLQQLQLQAGDGGCGCDIDASARAGGGGCDDDEQRKSKQEDGDDLSPNHGGELGGVGPRRITTTGTPSSNARLPKLKQAREQRLFLESAGAHSIYSQAFVAGLGLPVLSLDPDQENVYPSFRVRRALKREQLERALVAL